METFKHVYACPILRPVVQVECQIIQLVLQPEFTVNQLMIHPAKGSAVFECEVSLPGVKPQWYKDEEPITVSDGYDIRSDGTHHYLYLDKVGPDDIGDYTIQFDDVECTASLQIEGRCRWHVDINQ